MGKYLLEIKYLDLSSSFLTLLYEIWETDFRFFLQGGTVDFRFFLTWGEWMGDFGFCITRGGLYNCADLRYGE